MNRTDSEEFRTIVDENELISNYRSTSIRLNLKVNLEQFSSISWRNLTIVTEIVSSSSKWFQRKERVVLSKTLAYELNGYAEPGQILAILGNSGAGKTTLLKSLSGRRNTTTRVEGSIFINGREVAPTILCKKCGLIDPNELFLETMTVREHLTFQAMLRIPNQSDEFRYERINDVLEILDLIQCQNTPIGNRDNEKTLSDAEFRRLTIGSVILTNPSILLIDEPTTGLDTNSSKLVMNSIKRLADQGKTLIVVLRYPSSQIFQMIDQICLLSHGYLTYFGSRSDAQEFFSSIDRTCPARYNPSEFYLEQLSERDEENSQGDLQRPPLDWTEIVEIYRKSTFCQTSIEKIDKKKTNDDIEFDVSKDFQSNFFRQVQWLFWRSFRSALKRFSFKFIFTALIFGLVFLQLRNTPEFIQNVNAFAFVTLLTVTQSNAFLVLQIFPREFQLFHHEHRQKLYNCTSFFLAKIFTELPFYIIIPWIFTTVTYIFVGLYKTFPLYFGFCLSVTLASIASNAFAGLVVAAMPSIENATSWIVPLFEIFILFGGFFFNNATIPIYFCWIRYVTWFYYAYSSMLVLLWNDVENLRCNSNGFCLSNGDDVLNFFDVSKNKIGFYLSMLGVLIVVYYLLTFLIIWLRSRNDDDDDDDES